MSKKLIEAALFMSSRPMTHEEIAKITGVPVRSLEKHLAQLQKEYAEKGVEIIRGPEGWYMRVKPELLPKVAHLTPYSDLKDGHKRTLALVAYKEPVKQSDVVHIQGNKAYAYVKFLRKKGLIKSEKEGRTANLMITKEFERYFGLGRAKIKEMLRQSMEAEKAKADEKPKAEAKPLPAAKPEAAKTPPTNVQYIEVRKEQKQEEAGKPEERKVVIRKSRKTTPAGRIGTRRPAVS
jgi:segregation and condensation protein B